MTVSVASSLNDAPLGPIASTLYVPAFGPTTSGISRIGPLPPGTGAPFLYHRYEFAPSARAAKQTPWCAFTRLFSGWAMKSSGVPNASDTSYTVNVAARVVNALHARDPEAFVEAFRQFFAAIPYDLTDRQNEQSWQAIMYVVLRIIGINVGGEVRTHKGRIDLTVKTATDAYIIEVKRDSTAKKAIEQIQDKSYTDRFRPSGKPITLIGIAFSMKKRTISGVKIVRDA